MRYFLLLFGLVVISVMVIAGKRGDISRLPPIELFPDMDRQPKLRPQKGNDFFKNGFSSQEPVAGSVARGSAYEEIPVNTGKVSGTTNWVDFLPLPVTETMLRHGQERFNIYCAPCHGVIGDGKGITTKYGMVVIRDLHLPQVVRMSDGQLFHTISYGQGLMQPYAAQIAIPDRWAIVAYVRALQRARLASTNDVPAEELPALLRPLPPAGAGSAASVPAINTPAAPK